MDVFQQFLDLDNDDSRDFSRAVVFDFFSSAEGVLASMDSDLQRPSSSSLLSHYGQNLKDLGSSLGVYKLQTTADNIRYYGGLNNGDRSSALTGLVAQAHTEYMEARNWLITNYYPSEQKRRWYKGPLRRAAVACPNH